jgi:hypothetical protein
MEKEMKKINMAMIVLDIETRTIKWHKKKD